MSQKSTQGYLVGAMEMIDKISKANQQTKEGLISEHPDEQEIIGDYFQEMADSLKRLRIRIKQVNK